MSAAPPPFSGGPLQQSDLLGIWVSVMDDSYTQPFIEAGDGNGLEGWSQLFAQLARVSEAVDVSLSSLFILPWSGQTNPPATGPQNATVTLSLARTGLLHQPLVLAAGTWVDEVAPDWSPTGTVEIVTGLRYALATTVVFEPGESGPMTVSATAERPGFGYNNPLPGSLNTVEQPGTAYYNVDAAIANSLPSLPIAPSAVAVAQMTVLDVPHVVIPGHVGQYVTVTSGTNVGAVLRMNSFRAANPGVDGGAVGLDLLFAVHAATITGAIPTPGELALLLSPTVATTIAAGSNGATLPQGTIHVASTAGFPAAGSLLVDGSVVTYTGTSGGNAFTGCNGGSATLATGDVVASVSGYANLVHVVEVGSIFKLSFLMRTGVVAPGTKIVLQQSSTSLTVDIVYTDASTIVTSTPSDPPALVPSTEAWRVLDWVQDWGLSVTNAAQPSGGTAGTLDLLGLERNLPRISGEDSESYRLRISTIADVVTPNAIKRRLNKVLTQGPLNLSWCFREIGTPLFPGLFCEVDFFDYDCQVIQPSFAFSGVGFQLNEPVSQVVGGVVATGRILQRDGTPATPFVPGNAGATGQPGARVIVGVAGIRLGYPFVENAPIVGLYSATSLTPLVPLLGGLGVQYPGNDPSAVPVSNAWRILVDYLRMRAYFVVCVQRSGVGDFGFAWGSGAHGVGGLADWWDSGPNWNDFYDGAPLGAAAVDLSAFHAIDAIRAAGVVVEFYPQTGPCS